MPATLRLAQLYVRQARERDIPVKTFTIPMHDVDRAIADGEEAGFVKIHVVARTAPRFCTRDRRSLPRCLHAGRRGSDLALLEG
jgi:hypothetical protein